MQQRRLSDVLDGSSLITVDGSTSVADAAKLMADRHIGAVIVMVGDRVHGIFSERDVVNRVVALSRDPAATQVADVMTTPVMTGLPETKAVDALRIMQENGFRHLPVCRDGRPLGMVSLRDFMVRELAEAQDEVEFEHAIEEELW